MRKYQRNQNAKAVPCPGKKEKKIEDTTDYTIFPQHKKLAKQKTTVLIFLFNLLAICVRGPTFSQTNEINQKSLKTVTFPLNLEMKQCHSVYGFRLNISYLNVLLIWYTKSLYFRLPTLDYQIIV